MPKSVETVGSIAVGERPQFAVAAPAQAPAWQVSLAVQASPSSQAVPIGRRRRRAHPRARVARPALWRWSCAAQVTGFPPTTPPSTSVGLRAGAGVAARRPIGLGRTRACASRGVARACDVALVRWCARHRVRANAHPVKHVSVCVQGLPSLHKVPSRLSAAPTAVAQRGILAGGAAGTWPRRAEERGPSWGTLP